MGEVFLGETPGGRKVVVKLIRAKFAADPSFRARFAREVEAARRVGGFHTAAVVDADPEAYRPWMISAYIPGPSLAAAVRDDGALSATAVAKFGTALSEGLEAIHACGLVHRDLKPSNIIMADDGPRIIDFGIARAVDVDTLTGAGALIGTLPYMSPEQIEGLPVGPESDVFSLGSVLTFAATGHGPFDFPYPAVASRIREQPPDLRGLPSMLHDVITACLEKQPGQRPSLRELRGRLAAVAGSAAAERVDGVSRREPGQDSQATRTMTHDVPPKRPAVSVARAASGRGPNDSAAAARNEAVKMNLSAISRLAFSPDGRLIAVAGEPSGPNNPETRFRAYIVDATTGRVIGPAITGPARHAEAVAFSPDGRLLMLAGRAFRSPNPNQPLRVEVPVAQLVDVSTRERVRLGPGSSKSDPSWLVDVAFAHSGSLMATVNGGDGGGYRTCVWSLHTRQLIGRPFKRARGDYPTRVELSSDGRLLVSENSVPRVCDTTVLPLKSYAIKDFFAGLAVSTCLSPNGNLLAVYWDKELTHSRIKHSVRLYDTQTRRPASSIFDFGVDNRKTKHPYMAFSPDGQILAVARSWYGSTKGIVLCTTADGRPIQKSLPVHGDPVAGLAFSPDGRFFAAYENTRPARAAGAACLWHVASGKRVPGLTGNAYTSGSIPFSPDGRILAVLSADRKVCLWDTIRWKPLVQLMDHDPHSAVFSPDGQVLATAAKDTLKLWHLSSI